MRRWPRHSVGHTWSDGLAGLGLADRARADLQRLFAPLLPGARVAPTPTGRHALWRYLQGAGLAPGDQALVAAYNYYPVVQILVQAGLEPVFVDVEPETLCMDPARLEEALGPRSRLVLVTHMFGHPADLGSITRICRAQGLRLFEDCAHAPGTLWGGRQVGAAGDGALFSFGIYKILSALGGGMLALPQGAGGGVDPESDEGGAWASFRDAWIRAAVTALMSPALYGWALHPLMARTPLGPILDPSENDPGYRFEPSGRGPMRPSMIAMLAGQLDRLEANVAARRALGARLREALDGVEGIAWLEPDRHGRANGSYLGMRCLAPGRGPRELHRHLLEGGLSTRPREFLDCSQLPQFARWARPCPAAAEAEASILRLPSYPGLGEAGLGRLIEGIRGFSR